MNKWMIVIKAMVAAGALSAIKFGLHALNWEFIEINSIISALISGVIFTMAVLLTGVMSDFKESEKIPGDLAASIKGLHKDLELVEAMSKKEAEAALLQLKSLITIIIKQFESNTWKQSVISEVIEKIDKEIAEMAVKNVVPAYIVKMRNELNNIERISNRVDTIEETNFLPAAYALSQTAITRLYARELRGGTCARQAAINEVSDRHAVGVAEKGTLALISPIAFSNCSSEKSAVSSFEKSWLERLVESH